MFNYWRSTQVKLQNRYNKRKLQKKDERTGDVKFSAVEIQYLYYWQLNELLDAGKKIGVHQRIICTAMIYFHRFYKKNGIGDCDPSLVVFSSLLLASKIEEAPIKSSNLQKVIPKNWIYSINDILEMEPYLMGELQFFLIVHHPFQSLEIFMKKIGVKSDSNVAKTARTIVNDSYLTDVLLHNPPYLVAISAIYISFCVRKEADMKKFNRWCKPLNLNMKKVGEISKHITNMYVDMKEYGTGASSAMLKLLGLRDSKKWKKAAQDRKNIVEMRKQKKLQKQIIQNQK